MGHALLSLSMNYWRGAAPQTESLHLGGGGRGVSHRTTMGVGVVQRAIAIDLPFAGGLQQMANNWTEIRRYFMFTTHGEA